jgi:hypothetical protein
MPDRCLCLLALLAVWYPAQEFHPYVFQILAQLIELSDTPLGAVSCRMQPSSQAGVCLHVQRTQRGPAALVHHVDVDDAGTLVLPAGAVLTLVGLACIVILLRSAASD